MLLLRLIHRFVLTVLLLITLGAVISCILIVFQARSELVPASKFAPLLTNTNGLSYTLASVTLQTTQGWLTTPSYLLQSPGDYLFTRIPHWDETKIHTWLDAHGLSDEEPVITRQLATASGTFITIRVQPKPLPPVVPFAGKPLKVIIAGQSYQLASKDLVSSDSITAAVARLATQVNVAMVPPKLEIEGTTVKEFVAPKDGLELDATASASLIATASGTITLPIQTVRAPSIASTNTLGITELIGRGDSQYVHSIPGRVHNVSLTTQRINAHIVMPGEKFSFNQTLGEVSAATGFEQAYVIMQGQTVLGDGGGVCQVSSTMFRAILAAGLPILERRGHSYRVGYYEQNSKPGFDATVYGPHPDLVFLNDTNTPILINAQADPKTLKMYVEFYGKKDGRTATITNYSLTDVTPAPPAVYQDDPTLKIGTLKQIDFAAGGAKTSFDYTVTYPDGKQKKTTYTTTYIPWRAVYLRGTKIN